MKSFIVLALFVAAAVAAPVNPDGDAQIVAYDNNNIGVEKYNYGVKTSNGIEVQEEGGLTNLGAENEALEVRGAFSYIGDDGVTYRVTYTSGVNGFQPSGVHIPVAP